MSEMDLDKIRYVKGILYGWNYTENRITYLKERLALINEELNGMVSSPRIKSTEEAKYKQSPPVYHSRIPELIVEEEELTRQLEAYMPALKQINGFMDGLDKDEAELINYRFKHMFTLEALAGMYYTNKDTIARRINRILMKF